MGAQIRIMPSAEADQGFSLLKDIVDMVKNPKAIDEAYEARRKAAELTDDEVAKSEEARALIAQADSLRDELKKREDALESAKTEHNNAVFIHIQNVQSDNLRLSERQSQLDTIAEQQAENDKKQAEDRKNMEIEIQSAKDDLAGKEKILDSQREENENLKLTNQEEANRLAEWAKKLKAKAARVAAEAESDV